MNENIGFHRKYRPLNIDSYIGNINLKTRVEGILKSENKPQVILLEGHSGCGKTTMARLLAKEYLCENSQNFGRACGECVVCKGVEKYISTGDFGNVMNLHEYDIGSIGKRDITAILEEMSVPSFMGGWKVYILDEVHLLSPVAQGALLKNLEEPPKDVLIILCTTDPQKLLDTVLGRCQYRLKVEKPSAKELVELLKNVCVEEETNYEKKALQVIAERSGLTPRKALTLLESIITEYDVVSYSNVVSALGIIADKYFMEFYRLLLEERSIPKYITFIGNMLAEVDINNFIEDLNAFTIRGLYACYGVTDNSLDASDVTRYKKLFGKIPSDTIVFLLSSLLSFMDKRNETELILFGYDFIEERYVKEHSDGIKAFSEASKQEVVGELTEARENVRVSETATEEDIKSVMEEFFG